jgi:hypothetical protein
VTGADEPYVVVHGGVHKTATSHLQSILQRNAGRLSKSNVHYIHHRDVRKRLTVPVQANVYTRLGMDWDPKISDAELSALTGAFFDDLAHLGTGRLIVSEENMTGHCGHCVKRGLLYRWRRKLVQTFAAQFPYPVREVHLGLRNYADFFASAYVEFLRSAQGQNLIPEARMKKGVLSHMPGWSGVLGEVRGAFPDARLIVWRHEDFEALSGRIIAGLCGPGINPGALVMPARARGRPSASDRAVRELLSEVARIGGEAALARRVEIQQRYPRGPDWPAYDPWTPEERAHLIRLYDRDIAEIRRRGDVAFLTPG